MVKFIVDSTFGLTREYVEQYDIKVVSLTVLIGSEEFEEGFHDSWPELYQKLSSNKGIGKTSQPSPDKYVKAIEQIYAEDEDSEIIIFTIADRLSGTIGSANVAVSQFEGKKIVAVNSGEAGPSALMFMREVVKAREDGATFEQILELAPDLQQRIAMQFIPASLTELARGGRVNKLLSCLGNILKLKPVFEFAKNDLCIYAKSIGFNRAAEAAISHLPEKIESIMLYYIGDDKYIAPLKEHLSRRLGITDVEVQPMCLVGGVHIGIGTVGIVTLASKNN